MLLSEFINSTVRAIRLETLNSHIDYVLKYIFWSSYGNGNLINACILICLKQIEYDAQTLQERTQNYRNIISNLSN